MLFNFQTQTVIDEDVSGSSSYLGNDASDILFKYTNLVASWASQHGSAQLLLELITDKWKKK